jgi:glycerol-3-phosphate dehydrogenase (NAD(P)+)
MANVAIVGAGMMGTATAYPLADNGHTVRLVGTHLDG